MLVTTAMLNLRIESMGSVKKGTKLKEVRLVCRTLIGLSSLPQYL